MVMCCGEWDTADSKADIKKVRALTLWWAHRMVNAGNVVNLTAYPKDMLWVL